MAGIDLVSASDNEYIMHEVGRTLVNDPDKILDLLESNDVDVASLSSPIDLGDAFLYELPYNEALQLGTAYLIERNNSSFTGEVDNENIYSMFEAISDYWSEEDEEYPEDEEPNSNVAGALIGGFKIAKNLINNRNQKNSESREALLQGIIAQKKAEAEALRKKAEIDAKNKRIKTISIVSVLGLIAVITAVVYIKKQKNG
jgi:hypothetical protein